MVRLGGVSAGVLAVSLVLAGCSAEAGPQPLPPVPSVSPVSPTPAVLPMPPEARAETPQGASAFARYYLALVGEAFASGAVEAVREHTAAGCGGCEALLKSATDLSAQQQRRIGGRYAVIDVAAPPVNAGDVVLLITYRRSASQILDSSGSVVATGAPVPEATAQMRLLRKGSSWVVQGYRVIES